MNKRAALVDAWRLIAFNAQHLEGGVEPDVQRRPGHAGQQPGRVQRAKRRSARRRALRRSVHATFGAKQLPLGLDQLPVATPRSLYQFEDGVNFTLRNLLRMLDQLRNQHGDSSGGPW